MPSLDGTEYKVSAEKDTCKGERIWGHILQFTTFVAHLTWPTVCPRGNSWLLYPFDVLS